MSQRQEKSFDEKMRELDEIIDRNHRSIDASLFRIALQIVSKFRYTNNSGTAS